jgi:hypothetical protein
VRNQRDSIAIVCSDRPTGLEAGTAIVADTNVGGLTMPYGFSLLEVQASLVSGASTGTFTVDVNVGGTTVLSTTCTIDATEETSQTAAVPSVLSNARKIVDIPKGSIVSVDVDDDGSGDALGLTVYLVGLQHF